MVSWAKIFVTLHKVIVHKYNLLGERIFLVFRTFMVLLLFFGSSL